MRHLHNVIIRESVSSKNRAKKNFIHAILPTAKCITIAPGGYLGLYMLGTIIYIKNNYKIEEYNVGGVSAGALLSIYATSKKSNSFLITNFIQPLLDEIEHTRWETLLQTMRGYMIDIARTANMDQIYISATLIKPQFPWLEEDTKSNFTSSEDMVNYALASACVPFLCGFPYVEYDTQYYIDGAFTGNNPIPDNKEQILYISPRMWGRNFSLSDCLVIDRNRASTLIKLGYEDAANNRKHIPLRKRAFISRFVHNIRLFHAVRKIES